MQWLLLHNRAPSSTILTCQRHYALHATHAKISSHTADSKQASFSLVVDLATGPQVICELAPFNGCCGWLAGLPTRSFRNVNYLLCPTSSHPIISRPIPSYPISSHIISFYPIPSYPIPSHPISSHRIPFHPISFHLLPSPIPSHTTPCQFNNQSIHPCTSQTTYELTINHLTNQFIR